VRGYESGVLKVKKEIPARTEFRGWLEQNPRPKLKIVVNR
jgi:hypothetical protein